MSKYYSLLTIIGASLVVAVALPGAAQAQCRDCFSFQAEDPEDPEEMIWVHAMKSDGGSMACDGHGGGEECHEDVWTQTCTQAHIPCSAPVADIDIDSLRRQQVMGSEDLQRVREGLANGSVFWSEDSGRLLFLGGCDRRFVVAAVTASPAVRDALALPF